MKRTKNKCKEPQANEEIRTRPMPAKASGHIKQLPPEESACAACGTCELVCALAHDFEFQKHYLKRGIGPNNRRLWVHRKVFEGFPSVLTCHQCDAPQCYFSCPIGALKIDPKTKARYIDEDRCVGCKKCMDSCVFDHSRINYDVHKLKSMKCDLCKDRPEGPACVEFCPQQVLVFEKREG